MTVRQIHYLFDGRVNTFSIICRATSLITPREKTMIGLFAADIPGYLRDLEIEFDRQMV
jgi:hypothetical protein